MIGKKIIRKYTKEQFETAVKQAKSIREVLLTLQLDPKGGGSYRSFYNAIKEWEIDISHFVGQASNKGRTFSPKRDVKDYLTNKQPIQSYPLKRRLIKDRILIEECSVCKLTIWNNQTIPLELDHIDGNHLNNELSNLRLICPNCHAQTNNHAGKNKKKK
jgi:5-methylcytosine-specific restriction endonuclease McrA